MKSVRWWRVGERNERDRRPRERDSKGPKVIVIICLSDKNPRLGKGLMRKKGGSCVMMLQSHKVHKRKVKWLEVTKMSTSTRRLLLVSCFLLTVSVVVVCFY